MATGDVLRAYRWAELTLHRKEWRSGSGESADWGTRITVMAQDGSVVVVFEGNEPDGAGCLDMEKLHEAAVCGPGGTQTRDAVTGAGIQEESHDHPAW